MRTNIPSSIQEYCKKINSALSFMEVISLLITTLFLAILLVWITVLKQSNYQEVIYSTHSFIGGEKWAENSLSKTGEDTGGRTTNQLQDTSPFGSKKGKTYTFSWCMGHTIITQNNKIYFATEEEARSKGRTLSKLCKK